MDKIKIIFAAIGAFILFIAGFFLGRGGSFRRPISGTGSGNNGTQPDKPGPSTGNQVAEGGLTNISSGLDDIEAGNERAESLLERARRILEEAKNKSDN